MVHWTNNRPYNTTKYFGILLQINLVSWMENFEKTSRLFKYFYLDEQITYRDIDKMFFERYKPTTSEYHKLLYLWTDTKLCNYKYHNWFTFSSLYFGGYILYFGGSFPLRGLSILILFRFVYKLCTFREDKKIYIDILLFHIANRLI